MNTLNKIFIVFYITICTQISAMDNPQSNDLPIKNSWKLFYNNLIRASQNVRESNDPNKCMGKYLEAQIILEEAITRKLATGLPQHIKEANDGQILISFGGNAKRMRHVLEKRLPKKNS